MSQLRMDAARLNQDDGLNPVALSPRREAPYCFSESQWRQFLACASAMLTMVVVGTINGWTMIFLHYLIAETDGMPLTLTHDEYSLIVYLTIFGSIIGSLAAAHLADRNGRKNCLLLCSTIFSIGWFIIYRTTSVQEIYLARVIHGVGVGIAHTINPVYVSEVANSNIRGAIGTVIALNVLNGIVLTCALHLCMTYKSLIAVLVIISFMSLFSNTCFPETPYFLLGKGRMLQACRSIAYYKGIVDPRIMGIELDSVRAQVVPSQSRINLASQSRSDLPSQSRSDLPSQSRSDLPSQSRNDIPPQPISDSHLQSISSVHLESISDSHQPFTSEIYLPSTSEIQRSSIGETHRPSTSEIQQSSTSEIQQSSTSEIQQSSTSETHRPPTSKTHRPSTSKTHRPSTLQIYRRSIRKILRSSINETQRSFTSDTLQSSTSDTQQSSTSDTQRSSISETHQPPASDTQLSSASETHRPSTSDTQLSSASETHRPSTSETHQPPASETHRPSTSETHRPSTSETHRPSSNETRQLSSSETQRSSVSEIHRPSASETHRPSSNETCQLSSSETQRSSASETHRPSISEIHQPSTSEIHQPSTSKIHRSSTSKIRRPSTSETHRPSSNETCQLSSSETQRSSASETHQPSTSKIHRSSTSKIHRSSTSETHRPSSNETRQLESETQRSSASETHRSSASETHRPSTSETRRLSSSEIYPSSISETQRSTTPETRRLSTPETRRLPTPETRRLSASEAHRPSASETHRPSTSETRRVSSRETHPDPTCEIHSRPGCNLCIQSNVDSREWAYIDEVRIDLNKYTWSTKLRAILEPSNTKALFIMLGLTMAQQLSGNFITMQYLQVLFGKAAISSDPYKMMIIFYVLCILAGGITIVTVEYYGRRILMILSTLGTFCASTILANYLFLVEHEFVISIEPIPVFILLIYQTAFQIGLGTLPNVFRCELFPTELRGFVGAIIVIFDNIIGFIVWKLYQVITDKIGFYAIYMTFATSCCLAFLMVFKWVPETKGKPYCEIKALLVGETLNSSNEEVRTNEMDS